MAEAMHLDAGVLDAAVALRDKVEAHRLAGGPGQPLYGHAKEHIAGRRRVQQVLRADVGEALLRQKLLSCSCCFKWLHNTQALNCLALKA